jgi:hypothetical protein
MNAPIISAESCKNCKWSKATGAGMQCYESPPTTVLIGVNDRGPMFSGVFPPVEPDWRCGKYVRRLAIVMDAPAIANA